MRAVEFVSRSLCVKESQDWQGNRGILQAETTDHTLEEAEQYVKTNYPVFKKYRVRRAEPGFRANFDSSQFARSHAHVHDVDSAMDYLQLQENPVMSGSRQHSYSIGYSWHTNENRSSGIAVLYYEDRGMGSDEIIVAAKDRQNLAAAVGVFRDAGVVPQLKKKGVTEEFDPDNNPWRVTDVDSISETDFEVALQGPGGQQLNFVIRPVDFIETQLERYQIDTMDVRDLQSGKTMHWGSMNDLGQWLPIFDAIDTHFWESPALQAQLAKIIRYYMDAGEQGKNPDLIPGLDQRRSNGVAVSAADFIASHNKTRDAITKMKKG